ncbi:MAG TPA: ABC transporter ATP-binding protein [Burkholderiaceae bacterium]|nr:ABC transporter ATP-binding protein [Burkholderiaceae bacterium]
MTGDRGAAVLQATEIVAGYVAGLPIVHGVSVAAEAGRIRVLLGPNGAGKSTLVKAIAGVAPMFSGRLLLDGADVTGTPSHRLAATGIGYVPQTANVFTTLTVEDNLRIGGYLIRDGLAQRLAQTCERFPDLRQRLRDPASALSGGQRQMLAIARALMTSPRVLLLDEPSAGLSPLMVRDVFDQVRAIADSGVAILMVEQNVRAGLRIADDGVVLANGRIAHAGPAAALAADPQLAQAYLGRLGPGGAHGANSHGGGHDAHGDGGVANR